VGAAKLGRVRPSCLRLLVSLPLVALFAGCASSVQSASSARRPPTATAPHCRTGTTALGNRHVAVAATVRDSARAYRRPADRSFASFGRLNQNGFPTVFRALAVVRGSDCRARWYRVQLPLKPNGVTGFVRASAVRVSHVRTRILIDVSARKLSFFRGGKRILRTTVAVGSAATPTPTGRFYVNQLLVPADTSGPFGPGAIGTSAFSDVLTGWVQDGPIAIHGTNEPWSIGKAASNGCVRVANPVLLRMFRSTRAGTPVVIRQ
jgi:lipoprotein-anchoring transpeptidase ErfK/SrfK